MSKSIRIRGARQNNLQGIDLDLPLGRLIVVTGPSGSGKSSLAFDTIYAEGQRRYVETFSPYTRQFLDRMDKPKADSIEGIPPAIAIEQSNNVRSTRSTVGTITEINDYLKLFFSRAARAECPECHRPVRPETAQSIVEHVLADFAGETVLVTFAIPVPPKTKPADFYAFLQQQGFLRVLLYGEVVRTDEPPTRGALPGVLPVIQDRITVTAENRTRLSEAVEHALRLGQGKLTILDPASTHTHPYSSGWHCAHCDLSIRPPSPGLFTFNNPLGACPSCRGFGRIIGIDYGRVMPDTSLSIADGVIKPFQSGHSRECQDDLVKAARRDDIDIYAPFKSLPKREQKWVLEGDTNVDTSSDDLKENDGWYGVHGFFKWLEARTYKMHIRVLLSRYRSYQPCPACHGGRFQPETLNYRLEPAHLTLPEIARLPIKRLIEIFDHVEMVAGDPSAILLRDQIRARLRYLETVGLGYLSLDRPTRTLSGGEIERVNLTTCLGASLVNALFVMDEPSVGLHPRDTARLLGVMRALRDKGNTLLVVEHEEAIIRAADHLVDIGPGRGKDGGLLTYSGPLSEVKNGLTASYLSGEKFIPVPTERREPLEFIELTGIEHHNLHNLDVRIPLGVFCCVTGVSGSGKSTLIHNVLYRNLVGDEGSEFESAGKVASLDGAEDIEDIVMVDQSTLARSPRSTSAVYIGAFDGIRQLFAATEDAVQAGFTPGSFSFNSGNGRCERCAGLGFEKVEMQFLSDLFLRCPECDGRRYQPPLLKIQIDGKSIADVLEMTVREAIDFFTGKERHGEITRPLQLMADVGLDYLRLGQPLNVLSGGESQRLKLVTHLVEKREAGALLIFDEPTTGLHIDDVAQLLKVFQRLVDEGNSLIVIEHNLEVIKSADWVVDLGPEAGDEGGQLVAEGTPEQVADVDASHTGRFLRPLLHANRVGESLVNGHSSLVPLMTNDQYPISNSIRIRGAREHNLKDISIDIPRDKVVVVTGMSGSGKSTLAFDILFAEGQRRFLDSMSPYARQFVEQLEKPEVDSIEGLPPSVAIEQRVTRGGGKSTVATVTEIYHFLRLMFSKLGTQYCPDCDVPVVTQTVGAITTHVEELAQKGRVQIFAPLVKARKGFHTEVARWAERHGYTTLLVDGKLTPVASFQKLERFKEHTIDVLIGELTAATIKDAPKLVRLAITTGKGTARVLDAKKKSHILSTEMNCPTCERAFEELDPRMFSFNSPHGWCEHCRGFGEVWRHTIDAEQFESQLEADLAEERNFESLEDDEAETCPVCEGSRLNAAARAVRVKDHTIAEFTGASSSTALMQLEKLRFTKNETPISHDIVAEIAQRLKFLNVVGLGYLSLDRSAKTLSGGESQRIRLAAQLGSNLRGVLYVLDEPTIGLHPRDNDSLLDALVQLAKNGNSLVIVEHDEDTMRRADHLIDLGPRAGRNGGRIVAQGTVEEVMSHRESLTAKYLREPMRHPLAGRRRDLDTSWIELKGATIHNLKDIDVRFPINRLTVVTGISGSGKSSLVRGALVPAVRDGLTRRSTRKHAPTDWKSISGLESLGAVLEVDQSPIGKTSRSTPATYIKVLDEIRNVFAQLPESRVRGYTSSRFSFNNEGGRCENCTGQGVIKLEMSFLPTSYMPCEECRGKRYNPPTLEVLYNDKSIGDVMEMTVDQAAEFFAAHPKIKRSLDLLVETGLGYLTLGQPSPTLSGGEAQRIKLVTQLARRSTAKAEIVRTTRMGKSTLYVLEEPTIGLHTADVANLIAVLHRLVDEGGTVVVIEHHLDVVAEADYVIDIGPEAGDAGGEIVTQGTPEQVAKSKRSRTAPFLADVLKR